MKTQKDKPMTAEEFIDYKFDALSKDNKKVCQFWFLQMEEYANQSQWVSVSERVPEIDGGYSDRVLIWGRKMMFNDPESHAGIYSVNGRFYSGGDELADVTHWQPLPEPPKTGES